MSTYIIIQRSAGFYEMVLVCMRELSMPVVLIAI